MGQSSRWHLFLFWNCLMEMGFEFRCNSEFKKSYKNHSTVKKFQVPTHRWQKMIEFFVSILFLFGNVKDFCLDRFDILFKLIFGKTVFDPVKRFSVKYSYQVDISINTNPSSSFYDWVFSIRFRLNINISKALIRHLYFKTNAIILVEIGSCIGIGLHKAFSPTDSRLFFVS